MTTKTLADAYKEYLRAIDGASNKKKIKRLALVVSDLIAAQSIDTAIKGKGKLKTNQIVIKSLTPKQLETLKQNVSKDLVGKLLIKAVNTSRWIDKKAKDYAKRQGVTKAAATSFMRGVYEGSIESAHDNGSRYFTLTASGVTSKESLKVAGVKLFRWVDTGDNKTTGKPTGKYPNSRIKCWEIAAKKTRYGIGVYTVSEGATNGGKTGLHPKLAHPFCRCEGVPIIEGINDKGVNYV